MPQRAVKQPNGFLGIWSSVVDDFPYVDCSVEETYGVFLSQMTRIEALAKTLRGIEDVESRWAECKRTYAIVHGRDPAELDLLLCPTPDPPIDLMAEYTALWDKEIKKVAGDWSSHVANPHRASKAEEERK